MRGGTRRERMERRLQRRLDWAVGREKKAAAKFEGVRKIADAIPFGQPILVGHHSERHARKDAERIHNGMAAGVESQKMAAHHLGKADGIADQLDRSIFSDDTDAPERLRERIAGLEAERDRQKKINAQIKKGEGWEARLRTAGIELTEKDKADLLAIARHQPYLCKDGRPVFPAYHFQNLGSNIRRLKGRLEQIEQRARVVETLAKEGQACIVCGTITDQTFFCPCDLTHPLCSPHPEVERKDCAHIVPQVPRRAL